MVESEVVRKTTLEGLLVETIEWMEHPRTTVVHKLEHTQKGYIVDGKEIWKC
jgi:hypothetical protein